MFVSGSRKLFAGRAILSLVCCLMITPLLRAEEYSNEAVQRARRFFDSTSCGKDVVALAHFGMPYKDHAYKETRHVTVGGVVAEDRFALVYHYHWGEGDDAGWTDLAFLCDARGNLTGIEAIDSSGVFQQPFVMANATIKVVGQIVLDARKDQMTDADRKTLQQAIDKADSKRLLEVSLALEQAFTR